MYYIIKFIIKLFLVLFLFALYSIITFLELIFLFSYKNSNDFWNFINEIYYKNPIIEGEEKESNREIAKGVGTLDWLLDFNNRYHLSSYKESYNDLGGDFD